MHHLTAASATFRQDPPRGRKYRGSGRKRPGVLARFDVLVGHHDTLRLDDSTYRERSYRTVVGTNGGRPFSLVDEVLRAVIEDPNVVISAMSTFNPRDFHDVRRKHRVELPCRN